MSKIVGIVNLSDNSFSGDGLGISENFAAIALERVQFLFAKGADIVDIGAQSTSYGAKIFTPEEERDILLPVLQVLKSKVDMRRISIDTFNWQNASLAIEHGVGYINDVKGGVDTKMLELIALNKDVKYICMFSLCIPADKAVRVKDFVQIKAWCGEIMEKLLDHGICKSQIILDPGISFVTGPELSLELIKRISELKIFGAPLFIGHSRKTFLAQFTDLPCGERDIETLMLSLKLRREGVDYIRVHNVDYHFRAFNMPDDLV